MEQPATLEPDTRKNTPFRGACITCFGSDWYTELPDSLQYLAWGEETCPTTGKKHKQAFAYARTAKRLSAWKKLFPGAHIEQMRGTFSDNERYCSKEGTYTTLGVKPMLNGCKRSLEDLSCDIIQAARDQVPLDEIVTIPEKAPTFVQYHNGLTKLYQMTVTNKLRKTDKDFAPEVIYIWGDPGTGKSKKVRELDPEVFDIPEEDGYKWKDGYCGQDAVVYENVSTRNITYPERLLKEIDRYYMQVPVKGGYIGWRPKRIYITSVYSPGLFAQEVKFSKPEEFTRRVTKVIHLPSI